MVKEQLDSKNALVSFADKAVSVQLTLVGSLLSFCESAACGTELKLWLCMHDILPTLQVTTPVRTCLFSIQPVIAPVNQMAVFFLDPNTRYLESFSLKAS